MKISIEQDNQMRACQKLLSAVVALAVKDCQRMPIKPYNKKVREPHPIAITALDFLFTDSCEGYLTLLDIDPQHFRKKLIDQMYKDDPEDQEDEKDENAKKENAKKKNFRFNYEWFYENAQKVRQLSTDIEDRALEEVVDDESVVELLKEFADEEDR